MNEHRTLPEPYYKSNQDLPEEICGGLPANAQTLYRQAFNQAWAGHVQPLRSRFATRHDDVARRKAMAAVKRLYVFKDGTWVWRKSVTAGT